MSSGVDQETWDLFQRKWSQFKLGMGFPAGQASVQLFHCLHSDLQDDLLKLKPGEDISCITENKLIDAVKSLAVKIESKLIHRIKMGQQKQTPGTSIWIFHANLKGLARLCQFKIKC